MRVTQVRLITLMRESRVKAEKCQEMTKEGRNQRVKLKTMTRTTVENSYLVQSAIQEFHLEVKMKTVFLFKNADVCSTKVTQKPSLGFTSYPPQNKQEMNL